MEKVPQNAGLREKVDLNEASTSIERGVLTPAVVWPSIKHYRETKVKSHSLSLSSLQVA